MVNSEAFTKRLQKILEFYDLSAASFADSIEVGRSSISHLLSGRNKPSLDFVLKIVQKYPEVELYWLLNGKGNFPASTSQNSPEEKIPKKSITTGEKPSTPAFEAPVANRKSSIVSKPIRKIVIFYEDGTFEAFEN